MTSPDREGKATTEQSSPLPSLPDDLLLTCFARVSAFHYPILTLVSKRFQSLIASPELYKIRSTLGRNQSCLYVCFGSDHDPNPRCGNVLVPTSVPHSAPAHWSGLIGGPSNDIYNIGGPLDDAPSSSEPGNMWVDPMVDVLGRKIYVTRGCNPNTRTWDPEVSSPPVFVSLVVRKKVYMFGSSGDSAYKPKDGQWERFWGWKPSLGWFSCCVIEKVLYRYRSEEFKWYDTKAGHWRKLKGLTRLPKFVSYGFQLVDYGGKLAVLWAELVPNGGDKKKVVWCAVITLERPKSGDEIWGEIEWCDVVCTVPKSYQLEYALDATL
ncbi:hypothetical protein N665_0464s0004 [Sinapis alba]|nr:hypothetical protein N665_0464s0004 [Sinapis alba]